MLARKVELVDGIGSALSLVFDFDLVFDFVSVLYLIFEFVVDLNSDFNFVLLVDFVFIRSVYDLVFQFTVHV